MVNQDVAIRLTDDHASGSVPVSAARMPISQGQPRSPGEHFITEWASHHERGPEPPGSVG